MFAAGYGTASWIEIVWTLAAIPGFVLWSRSFVSSVKSLRAIRATKASNGRLLWARFSYRLTALMVLVELAFMVVGVIALSRGANPDANVISALVIAISFMTVSFVVTTLAYQWREVEKQILEIAKARFAEKERREGDNPTAQGL